MRLLVIGSLFTVLALFLTRYGVQLSSLVLQAPAAAQLNVQFSAKGLSKQHRADLINGGRRCDMTLLYQYFPPSIYPGSKWAEKVWNLMPDLKVKTSLETVARDLGPPDIIKILKAGETKYSVWQGQKLPRAQRFEYRYELGPCAGTSRSVLSVIFDGNGDFLTMAIYG